MKKFRLLMMAGLTAFAMAAQAQVTVLTAAPVTIENGGTADLVVSMDYDTEEKITAWGFSFYLPDGLAPIYDEEEEEWVGEVSADTNAKKVVNKGLAILEKTDGGWLITGYADGNPTMKSTHGELVKITLKATADVQGTGKINGISISNDASVSLDKGNIADVEFAINGGGDDQGVKDIKSNDSNAPVYNVNGIQVNAQAKGLLIQDGKKFIVK